MATHEIKTLQFASGVAIDPAVEIPTGNSLEELDDTTLLVSPPNDGDILIYNGSTEKWEAGTPPASKNIGTINYWAEFSPVSTQTFSGISTITMADDAIIIVALAPTNEFPSEGIRATGWLIIGFERSPSGAGTWTNVGSPQDLRNIGATEAVLPPSAFWFADTPGPGTWDYRVNFTPISGTYQGVTGLKTFQV